MKLLHLLVFASLTLSLHGEYTKVCLARTDFNAIQKAHSTIESLLKWHTFYQYATVATIVTGAGAIAYTAYKLANLPDHSAQDDIPLDQKEMKQLIFDMRVFFKHWSEKHNLNRNWMMSQLHWFKKTVIQNFNSILVGVGATLIFNSMNNALGPIAKYITRLDGFMDRTISEIFHKNNLEWFINYQANLIGLSSILKQHAALAEGRQITVLQVHLAEEKSVVDAIELPQRQKALQDFIAYWKLFIEQVESVLGFMHYKSLSNSNVITREQMIDISTKIQEYVNEFAKSCEDKIASSEDGTIMLYDDFLNLTAKIGFEFSNFSLLDSYKRLAVDESTRNI